MRFIVQTLQNSNWSPNRESVARAYNARYGPNGAMNLFAAEEENNRNNARPLAARMRPRTLAEFVGQRHILGDGKLLRRMLDADRIGSVIFYGPPGIGKTSLAELIAKHTQRRFRRLNATMAGVKDVRELLAEAENALTAQGTQTVVFIDELHRFSRSQQDILLPLCQQTRQCDGGRRFTDPTLLIAD